MERVSDKLFRGSRPSSVSELIEISHSCYAIVNLESGFYEAVHEDDYEKSLDFRFKIKQYKIKCSDITPPTKKQVNEFLDIVERSNITYVHCLHGKDRTGFMCAVYRMRVQGWTFKMAVKEMFEYGFHKIPYAWWIPFLYFYRT